MHKTSDCEIIRALLRMQDQHPDCISESPEQARVELVITGLTMGMAIPHFGEDGVALAEDIMSHVGSPEECGRVAARNIILLINAMRRAQRQDDRRN